MAARKARPAAPPPVDFPLPSAELRAALISWYRAHHRDLPWRRTRDPYAIWISEIMLQQTQVDVVKRYYDRFLQRFPDVRALADAPDEDVMGAWSGLGYYRRARLMHQAARVIRDQHGGVFPTTASEIRALPGVGAYTAGALLSIAFGVAAPAVDGNVVRVMMRLLGLPGEPDEAGTLRVVTEAASLLTDGKDPADVTQGLMELGATVCTPQATRCERCPWQSPCRARADDAVDRIPPPRRRAERKPLHVALALVWDGPRLCLVRRPSEGLFGGLWELPSSGEVFPRSAGAKSVAATALQGALREAQPALDVGRLLSRTERTLTHKDLSLWTFSARLRKGRTLAADARWCTPEQLSDAPLSTAMRAAVRDALQAWEALA